MTKKILALLLCFSLIFSLTAVIGVGAEGFELISRGAIFETKNEEVV